MKFASSCAILFLNIHEIMTGGYVFVFVFFYLIFCKHFLSEYVAAICREFFFSLRCEAKKHISTGCSLICFQKGESVIGHWPCSVFQSCSESY